MTHYRCPHCEKVVIREGDHNGLKEWRKSFCETTGKNARIQRMPDTTKQELLRACDIIGAAIKANKELTD